MTESGGNLAPGDVVSGLEPTELVEIRRLVPFGNKTLVEVIDVQTRRGVKRPLTDIELSGLVKVRGLSHTFDGDAELFLLGTEAELPLRRLSLDFKLVMFWKP